MNGFQDFFEPHSFIHQSKRQQYNNFQLGHSIERIEFEYTDWGEAEIIIIGCDEYRGMNRNSGKISSADTVREVFYNLYNWHPHIKIADVGNIKWCAAIQDTRAALRLVLKELELAGKKVIILGGSQDLTLEQYQAFALNDVTINACVVDMLLDLNETEELTDASYLLNMLTGHPNYVKNFSHIGFQSYYNNPKLLETLDKLRFDCFRLGKIKEQLDFVEPLLRNTHLLSIDLKALRSSDAPWNYQASPNGFYGDEMCAITKYAGMSSELTSLGIYGYLPDNDLGNHGAHLIAQMMWYFLDGVSFGKQESSLDQLDQFVQFNIAFTGNNCSFVKSKRTERWWMQLPNERYIPCTYQDYLQAANDEIPERWLREQERIV